MRQPTSADVHNVNHPKPKHDPGLSFSHRHSFNHARDDDEDRCYRPEPPTSGLDTNLLTRSSGPTYMSTMYQYGTPVSDRGGMSTLNPFYGATGAASSSNWNPILFMV